MVNRFNKCKTLADLYDAFGTEVADYNNLTKEELERIALVFEANRPNGIDMPDTPLTEAGYTFVWNVTVDTIETIMKKEEERVMTGTTGTVKGNINAAVEEMMEKFTSAKENIKGGVKTTTEEYVEKVDDSLNVVKGAFADVLGILDRGLGYTTFKNNILAVIEAGQNGTSKHDLFRMAKKCRELTEEYIQEVELLGNPGDAGKLKDLMEGTKGKSIFTTFFATLYWIGRRAFKTLRNILQLDNDKSILGAICRSVAGFVGVIRAGIRLVWNTAKFAVSFIAAGVIIVADIIMSAIKMVASKLKNWAEVKGLPIKFGFVGRNKEVLEDDFDEDFEDDFDEEEFAE